MNELACEAIQVFGCHGFLKEYKIERCYRDARILSMYEGPAEIQKPAIGTALFQVLLFPGHDCSNASRGRWLEGSTVQCFYPLGFHPMGVSPIWIFNRKKVLTLFEYPSYILAKI